MRKTTIHVWITMCFCAVALVAQAISAGSVHLPF
jgi:hypothetical protein